MSNDDHPFKRWLDREGETQTWARRRAEEIGLRLSAGHLSRILAGKARPSLDYCEILEAVSGGKVRAIRCSEWHFSRPLGDDRKGGTE